MAQHAKVLHASLKANSEKWQVAVQKTLQPSRYFFSGLFLLSATVSVVVITVTAAATTVAAIIIVVFHKEPASNFLEYICRKESTDAVFYSFRHRFPSVGFFRTGSSWIIFVKWFFTQFRTEMTWHGIESERCIFFSSLTHLKKMPDLSSSLPIFYRILTNVDVEKAV